MVWFRIEHLPIRYIIYLYLTLLQYLIAAEENEPTKGTSGTNDSVAIACQSKQDLGDTRCDDNGKQG